MRKLWIVLAVALLAACGGSLAVEAPTAAPAPAATAEPTAVPTPVPLDQIDLKAVLAAADTLPKGLTIGAIDPGVPKTYSEYTRPKEINAATLNLQHGKDSAGTVVVALYDDGIKTNDAYSVLKTLISLISDQSGDKAEQPDVGKQAIALTSTIGLPGTFMTFVRCRAVVDIYMTGDLVDTKSVTAYAHDLDSRLTEAVCQ